MKKVIEASMAVALAAKLAGVKVIASYPITPQTKIVEHLAELVNNGLFDAEYMPVESEHSALSACIGAQATGVRTFTATASQGLALMWEMLYIASGLRLPIVMSVANRTLSAPINIWNDQQDSIGARDSGWLQFYVESGQEALDTILMAYKIAEQSSILLPAMVCLDGFVLSHVYEQVDIPEQNAVDKFLPAYKPILTLNPEKPITMGPVAMPNSFMEFKEQQQKAMFTALAVIKKISAEFKKQFGRSYGNGLIEEYKTNDADCAIIAMGTVCGTVRTVIDELRKQGRKVGLIKIITFRPFPEEEIIRATKKMKAVAVLDRNISLGNQGALFTEIKAALKDKKIIINNFIAGLGGRDVTPKHLESALEKTMKAKKQIIEWLK